MAKTGNIRGVLTALAVLLVVGGMPAAGAQGQGQEHHAGLVIQFSDGSVKTYCLPFGGESITGMELLLKTGLPVKVEAYGMGGMVCKIGDDGCNYPGEPCVCKSYGPSGVYWGYYHLTAGSWKSAPAGASGAVLHDGDVDGWAWSAGKPPAAAPSYAQVCAAEALPAASSPAPSATPTSTEVPPTRTPRPARAAATPTRTPAPPTVPEQTAAPDAPVVRPLTPAAPPPSYTSTTTATPEPSLTPSAAATPTTAPTASTAPTLQLTPTPQPPAPPGGQDQDRARMLGIIAGIGAALAFAAWRALVALRAGGRGRTGSEL